MKSRRESRNFKVSSRSRSYDVSVSAGSVLVPALADDLVECLGKRTKIVNVILPLSSGTASRPLTNWC